MKRIICMMWLALAATLAFAQSEHLKFMGFPIDGTITQFQSKLLGKGCSLDKTTSSTLPAGCRAFNGTFVGNKVSIFVYYDNSTKIVYRVKAVYGGISEDIADQQYSRIKDLLEKKYDDYYYQEGTQSGKDSYSILPKRKPIEEVKWDNAYGQIDIFITKDESYIRYPYWFNLHIDYTDQINSDRHEYGELEDL